MKLVSIIVPIYNVEAYLFQCAQSVLCQTYPNIELILVNDGSADNSLAICEYFRKIDSRVRVLNKSNGGLVSARKAGLELSTGDYIYNLDGDDWINADCIATMLNCMESTAADMVVAGHSRDFIGVSVDIKNKIPSGFYDKKAMSERVYDRAISFGSFFQHGINTYSWGKLIKRKFALEAQMGIPDEIVMGEDAAFLYPLLYRIESMYVSDYCGYNYRQRPSSILKKVASDEAELENLGRLFRYLSLNIDASESTGVQKQLAEYFFTLALIRTGGFLKSPELCNSFNVFGELPTGSKICLYSSGSFGQHIYRNMKDSGLFDIVGWFDEDFVESRIVGLDVCDPVEIKTRAYDFVLIATVDHQKARDISDVLISTGVPELALKKVKIDCEKIESYIKILGYNPRDFNKLH